MILQIFTFIELLLRALGLYDGFINYLDTKRLADEELKRQAREKAVDDATKAQTPDDAFNAQDGIVSNEP